MNNLIDQHCLTLEQGLELLKRDAVNDALQQIDTAWKYDANSRAISRSFKFGNYHETMAFVNAVAWIAHQQDHHPDLNVGYNHCAVNFTTHAVGGLSINDFICATKIDALGHL